MKRRRFTTAEAAALAKRLHARVPAHELARGMNVELEHGKRESRTDVTHDDPIMTAKIALAHMNERPDYYDRLAEARLNPKRARISPMPAPRSITRELWDAQSRGASFDERFALAMSFSKDALASELTSGDPNADREGAMEAIKSELAEYVVEKAEDSRPRSNPVRETSLKNLIRRVSKVAYEKGFKAGRSGGKMFDTYAKSHFGLRDFEPELDSQLKVFVRRSKLSGAQASGVESAVWDGYVRGVNAGVRRGV